MVKGFAAVALVAGSLVAAAGQAEAKGCIRGALVGGVAGHYAGHGLLGAAAGCVAGRHYYGNKQRSRPADGDRDPSNAPPPANQ